MHMSPLEYINKVRIQTACGILKRQMSLSQILPTNAVLQPITPNLFPAADGNVGRVQKRPENYEQQLLKFDIHSEEGW